MRLILGSLVLCTLLSTTAPGQQQDTTPIPRELALSLIDAESFMGRHPTIIVGRAPAGFPRDLLPADVRILGAMVRSGDRGTPGGVTVVAVGPDSASVATTRLQSMLEAAGWKTPPMPESHGGFALSGPSRPEGSALCRDSTTLWVSVLPRERGGSLYHFMVTPSTQRYSVCNAENFRRAEAFQRTESFTFPTLRAPAGVISTGGGSCGSDDSREANTRLQTSLGVQQLMAHYATQLQAQGWSLGATAGDSTMALQLAKGKDDKGRELTGILGAVATSSPRERTVFFRINAATDDR